MKSAAASAGTAADRTRDVEKALGVGTAAGIRRWVVRGILILLAALIAAWIARGIVRWRETPPVQYVTEPSTRGELVVTVTATGALEPQSEVDVGCEVSGRVRAVNVDFNDHVKKGQVLAELDPEIYQAQLQQARAQLALARSTLLAAEATQEETRQISERQDALVTSGAVAEQSADSARAAAKRADAAVSQARAQIQASRAAVELAESNLRRTVVRSPIDGIVLARKVEVGQTVVAALQAPVLFQLAEDLTHMRVIVDIDEADIGQVRVGQHATFTVAAYPARDFDATVTEVRNAPDTTGKVVTYEAVLEVANDERLLRPGMTATASIVTLTEKGALLVPNEALRFRPDSGATTGHEVWVLRDGAPAAVEVKPGATNGMVTAVTDTDLEPGTPILINRK